MNGTKLVLNASSLLLATAHARCVFVHVAVRVRLPSPRAVRRNAYIYQASLCDEIGGWFCSCSFECVLLFRLLSPMNGFCSTQRWRLWTSSRDTLCTASAGKQHTSTTTDRSFSGPPTFSRRKYVTFWCLKCKIGNLCCMKTTYASLLSSKTGSYVIVHCLSDYTVLYSHWCSVLAMSS